MKKTAKIKGQYRKIQTRNAKLQTARSQPIAEFYDDIPEIEALSTDANREMGLPEDGDWGNK